MILKKSGGLTMNKRIKSYIIHMPPKEIFYYTGWILIILTKPVVSFLALPLAYNPTI